MNVSENIRFTGANLDAAFARVPEVAAHELLAAMAEADSLLEREVKDLMPTASGVSRASVFSREQALPGGVIGMVGSAMPQIVYVELGANRTSAAGAAGRLGASQVRFRRRQEGREGRLPDRSQDRAARHAGRRHVSSHLGKTTAAGGNDFRRATERIVKQMGAAT